MALEDRQEILLPVAGPTRAQSKALYISTFVCLALAWFTLILRLWTRIAIIHGYGWEDSVMVFAVILFTAFSIMLAVLQSLIEERASLTIPQVNTAANISEALIVFYTVNLFLLYLSVGLFFLRIMVDQAQRRFMKFVIALFTIVSIIYTFFAIFSCGWPGGKVAFWERRLTGQCMTGTVAIGMAYGLAISGSVSYLIFVSMPVVIIYKSTMRLRAKLIVLACVALAIVGLVASLIRFKSVHLVAQQNFDIFQQSVSLVMWSTIEIGVGITTGNLATLHPLLRRISDNITSRSTSRSNRRGADLPPTWTSPAQGNTNITIDSEEQLTFDEMCRGEAEEIQMTSPPSRTSVDKQPGLSVMASTSTLVSKPG